MGINKNSCLLCVGYYVWGGEYGFIELGRLYWNRSLFFRSIEEEIEFRGVLSDLFRIIL